MPEQTTGAVHRFVVEASGERVDRLIANALEGLSRTAVQRLIDAGEVLVNGAPTQSSYRVREADEVMVHVPPPQPAAVIPESIPLDILYEDVDLLVVNKPAGMVVHPGAGHRSGTLVNAVLGHCPDLGGVGGELRPGIVHRLDKDTSGVIVVAKNDEALRGLQRQFKRRTVRKFYTALLVGHVPEREGLIEAPIRRHPVHRRRMAVRAGGKAARTRWRVQKWYRDEPGQRYTLVDIRLLTGRTHQIRVHFAWMGYPLAGDEVYGSARVADLAPRQFLHARALAFDHPRTEERLNFTVELPADLARVLESLTAVGDQG